MKTKIPALKKVRKTSAASDRPPLPVFQIMHDPVVIMLPYHTGGVDLEALPREFWPAPSPIELATVTGSCGWANHSDGAEKAMALIWECAAVIRKSQGSAEHFVDSIKAKRDLTAKELRKACSFDYQSLPDRITHADFLLHFNTVGRLKVNGKLMRGRALFDHWLSLPEGVGMPLDARGDWHAHHGREGFDWKKFTMDARWDFLAVLVARFNEWRKETARRNNTGKKNLRRGEN